MASDKFNELMRLIMGPCRNAVIGTAEAVMEVYMKK